MSLALGSCVPSSIPRGGRSAGNGIYLTLLGGFQLRRDGNVVILPLPAERLLAFVALRNRPLLRPYVSVDIRLGSALALRLRDAAPVPAAELTADNLSFDLLPDWYEEWVILEREAFCQLRVHALESLCERLVEVGKFGPAVQAGLAAVTADPLRESAHRILIAAYLAEGNAGPALRQFETFSRLLEDELGLEPSVAMQALARHLRR